MSADIEFNRNETCITALYRCSNNCYINATMTNRERPQRHDENEVSCTVMIQGLLMWDQCRTLFNLTKYTVGYKNSSFNSF